MATSERRWILKDFEDDDGEPYYEGSDQRTWSHALRDAKRFATKAEAETERVFNRDELAAMQPKKE